MNFFSFKLFIINIYFSKSSDNNIGDIVNVGVKADLNLKNDIDVDIYTLLASLYNKQVIGIGVDPDFDLGIPYGKQKSGVISPEMIQNFAKLLSQQS